MKTQKYTGQKNVQKASKSVGQTEMNTEVMTFIEQTMQTLLSCNEKLKTFLNTDQTILKYFKLVKKFFFCNEKILIKSFYKKLLIKT